LTGFGAVIGIAVALAVTRLLRTLLFGISEIDPATFVAVTLVLTVVTCAACYLPAYRAARIDPMVVLRHE
jgi:ABC-type antimicrobial peptide transport system permease subunit